MVSTRNSKKKKEESTNSEPKNNIKRQVTTCKKPAADLPLSTNAKKRVFDSEDNEPIAVVNKKVKGKGKEVANVEEGDIEIEELAEEEDNDSDEEDDDSIDWETIQLPPRFEEPPITITTDAQEDKKETYSDVEVVMEAPRPVLK
jgi:hypothetical protein